MKYLGNVKVTLLKERQKYKELFSPLLESQYEGPARKHQGGGHTERPDPGKRSEEGYIILLGHHRKGHSPGTGPGSGSGPARRNTRQTLEALFDNASRRQMTETERKEKVNEKEKVQDLIYQENLIPELYALYKEGKIDRRSVDEFICADAEVQRKHSSIASPSSGP